MPGETEYFLYGGESPQDQVAFQRYLMDVQRGKSLLQLQAVAEAVTPAIRQSWSARTFTPIETSVGRFDEIVCNISYHFQKHGQKYGTIQRMTDEGRRYFSARRMEAVIRDGLLKFPNGSLYEMDSRIVTFVG